MVFSEKQSKFAGAFDMKTPNIPIPSNKTEMLGTDAAVAEAAPVAMVDLGKMREQAASLSLPISDEQFSPDP